YVVEAQPDLDTARETVGPSEEPDERHDTHHQGHDDDDARQKGAPQPLHHPRPPCHSHTNVATASRMRYQAKTSSRFVTRNLMKYFTVRYPTTADTPIPTRNRIASLRLNPESASSSASRAAAAVTAGILIRNVKRAATSRRRPSAMPAAIVAPDRETPGTSAAACAAPISSTPPNPS